MRRLYVGIGPAPFCFDAELDNLHKIFETLVMWEVTGNHLELLKGHGGDPFAAFVSALIETEQAISPAQISTTVKANIKDGGVDAQVDGCAPGHSWLGVPTAWQFKATSLTDAELRAEIQKPYVKELIKKGYGYRLATTADLPGKTRTPYTEILEEEVKRIDPSAPPPLVLAKSHLLSWANQFPAVGARIFGLGGERLLALDAWAPAATDPTPKYVNADSWDLVRDAITKHATFSESSRGVFRVHGEAGVGKTRTVYETLVQLPSARSLVVFTEDEDAAIGAAYELAADLNLRAILVADECSAAKRYRLNEILKGHEARVRAIAIDNAEGSAPAPYEVHLGQISIANTIEILAENFPSVPQSDRLRFAEFSGGAVRIAADFCVNFDPGGDLSRGFSSVRQWLYTRFPDPKDLEVLQAISLVKRLGFSGDVSNEIVELCQLLNLSQGETIERADKIRKTGFVVRAARWFYVSPKAITSVAFEDAWNHWADPDTNNFLETFPTSLGATFQERVSEVAPKEVRAIVSEHFRSWADELNVDDLRNLEPTSRFCSLIETEPSQMLPRLAAIIRNASIDELAEISGGYTSGGWGPRRLIVDLLSSICAFPEYFNDAEETLLRLAIAENEPKIANNATGLWKQMFRMLLSGTAVPFSTRVELLRNRITSTNEAESNLALEALDMAFETHASRIAGPDMIAGRIAPENWYPVNHDDEMKCWRILTELLAELSENPKYSQKAFEILIRHARTLLRRGFCDEIIAMTHQERFSQRLLPRLIQDIEEYLFFDSSEEGVPEEYKQKIREWLEALVPSDLHGKLVAVVGKDPWHGGDVERENVWMGELSEIANELQDGEALDRELAWLLSSDARSSGLLGEKLAALDNEGALLRTIFAGLSQDASLDFPRGYLVGLQAHSDGDIASLIGDEVEKLEQDLPIVAFHLALVTNPARALQLALRLMAEGVIYPGELQVFSLPYLSNSISEDERSMLVSALTSASEASVDDENRAAGTLAYILSGWFRRLPEGDLREGISTPEQKSLWFALDRMIESQRLRESYQWQELLKVAKELDLGRAVMIAVKALVSGNHYLEKAAEEFLSSIAEANTEEILRVLWKTLQEEKDSWRFRVQPHRDLFAALDVRAMSEWLKQCGREAAVAFAMHIPVPRLDDQGVPTVPEAATAILSMFEDDDEVFEAFFRGSMSHTGMRRGPLSAAYGRDAAVAREFLGHNLRRVREWASRSVEDAERNAREWHEREEIERIGEI